MPLRIARVFPHFPPTKATPEDEMAFTGMPDFLVEADEVHVSVTFTEDLERAKRLADAWSAVAEVKIGGPATGMRGEDFTPGMYIKKGYVITSRGCPNRCWFCSVPTREGSLRELKITEGWNVLDDNLLACSESHIRAVFAMLKRQTRKPEFTGGLEAARMLPWIAEALRELKPDQVFLAYDEPRDWDPLVSATEMLFKAGFPQKKHCIRAYVLSGYPGDTIAAADARMRQCLKIGVYPYCMVWRDQKHPRRIEWMRFQRQWARPAIISTMERP